MSIFDPSIETHYNLGVERPRFLRESQLERRTTPLATLLNFRVSPVHSRWVQSQRALPTAPSTPVFVSRQFPWSAMR